MEAEAEAEAESSGAGVRPTVAQIRWLQRGCSQPGGKLPLFDDSGQRVNERTVRSCLEHGWAEPWFANPLKLDWQVCRLTKAGRALAQCGCGGHATAATT